MSLTPEHLLDDETLELFDFHLCESGGPCEQCETETPKGELFCQPYDENYCRKCATGKIDRNYSYFPEPGECMEWGERGEL
jgi:hypothetical protein